MSLLIFSAFEPVYRRETRLLIGQIDDAVEYLKNTNFGLDRVAEFREQSKNASGLCGFGENGSCAIWMPSFEPNATDISVLVHECIHAYVQYARAKNIHYWKGDSEDLTGYAEFLVFEFLRQLFDNITRRIGNDS